MSDLNLRTVVERRPLAHLIEPGDGILLLGSCFTDHVGRWMADYRLPALSNPWGVLFNPASIARSLGRVVGGGYEAWRPELHALGGRFYSFDHHGRYSSADADELEQQLIALDRTVADRLAHARHLIVTLGTAWVYERQGQVVANCHRFPASDFTRRRLGVDEIVGLWEPLVEALAPAVVTLTVSPIRHLRDGLHESQLSKATLLLAADELARRHPGRVQYLPVYELFVDDLRDYRFYADDMVHPSETAIRLVHALVTDCLFAPRLADYMREARPHVRLLQHRPSEPLSLAAIQQRTEAKMRLSDLAERYGVDAWPG